MAYRCPNHGLLEDPYCPDCGTVLSEEVPAPSSPAAQSPAPQAAVGTATASDPKPVSQAEPAAEAQGVAPVFRLPERLPRSQRRLTEKAARATDPASPTSPSRIPDPPTPSVSSREPSSKEPSLKGPSSEDPSSKEPNLSARSNASTAARPSKATATAISEHRVLEQLIKDGYEVYLATGIGGCGKTQLLDAFEQQYSLLKVGSGWNPLREKMRAGRALPTAPGVVYCHPIEVGKRKIVFVDTSGETFRQLYPETWRTGRGDRAALEFLRLVAQNLAGLILLYDLRRLWDTTKVDAVDTKQVAIQTWILNLLRWLQTGDEYPDGDAMTLPEYVKAKVRSGKVPKLSCPVQIIYSKADEMVGLDVPKSKVPWGHRDDRKLYPVGEEPLLFTFHALRQLYTDLAANAKHFRFDFAHAMTIDPKTGIVEDTIPAGVLLSVEWLLDPDWRRPWSSFSLSTPTLIKIQKFFDRLTGKRGRWRRLPPSRDL